MSKSPRTIAHELVSRGVHYRAGGNAIWIPLDPGENVAPPEAVSEELVPKVLSRGRATEQLIEGDRTVRVTVPILVCVGRDGTVKGAELQPWEEAEFSKTDVAFAIKLVRDWKFAPLIRDGQPISGAYLVHVPLYR